MSNSLRIFFDTAVNGDVGFVENVDEQSFAVQFVGPVASHLAADDNVGLVCGGIPHKRNSHICSLKQFVPSEQTSNLRR